MNKKTKGILLRQANGLDLLLTVLLGGLILLSLFVGATYLDKYAY